MGYGQRKMMNPSRYDKLGSTGKSTKDSDFFNLVNFKRGESRAYRDEESGAEVHLRRVSSKKGVTREFKVGPSITSPTFTYLNEDDWKALRKAMILGDESVEFALPNVTTAYVDGRNVRFITNQETFEIPHTELMAAFD